MKLELKHLAPYLPYGLKAKISTPFDQETVTEIVGLSENNSELIGVRQTITAYFEFTDIKPILRPMSNLLLYFEYLFDTTDYQNIKDFLDEDFLQDKGIDSWEELVFTEANYMPFGTLQVLFKHHFDVFKLIDKDLAVSIHDVGQVVA